MTGSCGTLDRMQKVAVALSGGVDSAVSAHMLVDRGFDVTGVYMKYASETTSGSVDTESCTWQEDLESVNAVGRHLGIPITVLNVEREYDDSVTRPFLEEYRRGRTPNPDILCNRTIKFGFFFDWARHHGFDTIATGHYAQVLQKYGEYLLTCGTDTEKDQSYFLYAIDHGVLPNVMFPVGGMVKRDVRSYAREHRLPNADRPDSQGICFIGRLNVKEFIFSSLGRSPGPIETSDGTVIGRHEGLSYYTIGQRHGLGVGGGTPYYAARKDMPTQTLVVAKGKDDPIINHRALVADDCRWHREQPEKKPFRCNARIRYRQPVSPATAFRIGSRVYVEFDIPQHAVTPGQSIVLYDRDTVIGGGVIDNGTAAIPSERPV